MHVGFEVGKCEADVCSVYVTDDVDEDDDRQNIEPSLLLG
jgi:hypothetical protein